MATKNIPKTSDRKPQKRINWAKRTREQLAEAFNTSALQLIDGGISALKGSPNLSCFIEDEEVEQDRQKFLALYEEIWKTAESLPDAQQTVICSRLVRMEEMYYMRMHLGADKMAELLIRFYLQTHWNLSAVNKGGAA